MQTVGRDILTVERGIVCHQCNCRGVMGAGLALEIRRKWPEVYRVYHVAYLRKKLKLGRIQLVHLHDGLYIANLMAQDDFGRVRKQYTDYMALSACLWKVAQVVIQAQELRRFEKENRIPVYIPYGIGCGLGGGDWKIVSAIIDSIIPDAIVCSLPGRGQLGKEQT